MHEQGIQFPGGDVDKGQQITVTNRTGAALVIGGVYSRDWLRAAAESTTAAKGRGNITSCATANLKMPKVIALTTLADDETGLVLSGGPCRALVDGTTDVAVGDFLSATNASINLTKSTLGAVGDVQWAHAIALEARTADTAGLIEIFLLPQPTTMNGAVS